MGGGALGLAALAAAAGPLVLVVGTLAAGAVPVARGRARRLEGRRLRRVQLPAALERLATALRAGSPVPAALVEVGTSMPPPIGPELAALGREAAAGRATVEVLDAWSARHDDAGTRLAATALTLATAVGGAPGRTVDGVAATLRERVDLADERRALASQARVSALVLAVAPAGFAVLLGAADGAAASFLLGTPAGWVCLATGLALDALGAWWMARLTSGADA
ncbi:MAG TPA: type II secretion system F family protein [Acidimicrobiales bacterium]